MAVDCVIVGGGPAGLVAGCYLQRFRRTVALVDRGGGRASRIPLSLNYPGFPSGIAGPALLARLACQFDQFGGRVIIGEVRSITANADGFRVDCGDASWHARTVLLATGARDIDPCIPGIDRVRASGRLRECPICDGYEATGKRIVVIGRGSHGAREASFLTTFSDDIVYCSMDGAGSAELAERVRWQGGAPDRIACHGSNMVLEWLDGRHLACDLVYSAMGSIPQSSLASALGAAVDADGNLLTDAHGETNVPGVFAAGDVTQGLDQLSVAAGQAAVAATAIHNRLRAHDQPVQRAARARCDQAAPLHGASPGAPAAPTASM